MQDRTYMAIDLKSFYASVECQERGLDPLDTNLVVADCSRSEKTICLAVSPTLKAYGIPARARLFEVVQKIREINAERKRKNRGRSFSGSSASISELLRNPALEFDYITATPRMSHYMATSTQIYNIYLKYISPEDIHVYSIDEVFMDVTDYLALYKTTAKELAKRMMKDVFNSTGITATAGIGTNLYLSKIALDIMAKHVKADEDGVRIASLDERSYRAALWAHRPITDFWRVGRGYAEKLEKKGLFTMGDVARCSLEREDVLYKLFGVNAELLIDHAWGWEPCTMKEIKAYKPESSSIGSAQVLQSPYTAEKTSLVLREMAEALSLSLFEKHLATDQIVLGIGYDIENFRIPGKMDDYEGAVTTDHWGRKIPAHAHGSINLPFYTSSSKRISEAALSLFSRIADKSLLIRRLYLTANHVEDEKEAEKNLQPDLFDDQKKGMEDIREQRLQDATLKIKKRFGKNALLKATSLTEGSTERLRNSQIGGHKA